MTPMISTRAAVVTGPGRVDVRDVEIPAPGRHQIEVAVAACGICGTNLHHFDTPESIPEPRRSCPGALGHEIAAHVVGAGPGVEGLALGDLVVIEPQLAAACGSCAACEAGSPWFCTQPTPLVSWGFADRMVVNAAGAWPVDRSVGPGTATLVEPLAVAVHAVRITRRAALGAGRIDGARVAVLGAGVTGLLAAAAATHLGASGVAVLARHDHQAASAPSFGADLVVREADALKELRDFGPDLVVECAGVPETFALANRIVAPRGEISVVGLYAEPQVLDTARAFRNETGLVFPVAYGATQGVHDYEIAVAMLVESPERYAQLVTHEFGLEHIGTAFAEAGNKRGGALRVVVRPDSQGELLW
jgi:L-iditol 2-dehydrogenase